MISIVAVDKNRGIGCKGELLCPIKPDLENFKRLTLGKYVIYGSKTMHTFPRGEPLKGRKNFVLSKTLSQKDFSEDTVIFSSLESLLEEVSRLVNEENVSPDDFCVIGGSSVYEQLDPYVSKYYITRIDKAHSDVDCFFPCFEDSSDLVSSSRWEEWNDIRFRYEVWEKKDKVILI